MIISIVNNDYYPFGMPMPNRNIQDANGYRYAYQGQEKDPETGKEAFELRLWDGRIGRWLTTDPYRQHFSPYMAMGNNPISSIDPDGGASCGGAGEPPCPDGGWQMDLNEVVVTGSASGNIDRNYWSSEVNSQYDYGGTFAQWQQDFDFEGINYPDALNIWNSEDGGAWQQQVNQWDKTAQARVAVEKMTNFLTWGIMISTVLTPTKFVKPIPIKQFNPKFVVTSNQIKVIAVNTTNQAGAGNALNLKMNPNIKANNFYKLMKPDYNGLFEGGQGFRSSNGTAW